MFLSPLQIGRTGLIAAALLYSGTSLADSDLEEIVVTADYRDVELMHAPLSLTAISGQTIEKRSAQHLEHVLNLAPNVNLSSSASRARYVQIRGIGERGQLQEPINPSVGLIIDDVDFTGIGAAATLFDAKQVEVLRGPQGTRYGANAFAGLIFINTRPPTGETQGTLQFGIADYGTYDLGTALGGQISDQLLGRVAVQHYRSDGFTENRFLNRDNTAERDEQTVRAKLRWLATEDMTVDFSAFRILVDNGYDAFSLDNVRDTITDEPGRDEQDTLAGSVGIHWSGNPAYRLEAILAYNDSDSLNSFDEDWTFSSFHPSGYSSTDSYTRDRQRISAELRLVSEEAGRIFDNSTTWALGLYLLNTEEDLRRENLWIPAGNFNSQYETDTLAAFSQLQSQLTRRLHLTFGLRLEERQTDYQGFSAGAEASTSFAASTSETSLGGKLVLDYLLDGSTLFYAGISRGFKAGGLNSDPNLAARGLSAYDTEFVWSYEAGIKRSHFNDRLHTRLSAFYLDRQDQQVDDFTCIDPNTGTIIQNSVDCTSNFIDFLSNAADGSSYGLELEAQWHISTNLRAFGSMGVLETEISNYVNANGDTLDGRDQAHAPGYQFSLGTELERGNWYARLEFEGRDTFFFSEGHNGRSTRYELLHARLGYIAGSWDVALWARNLTDEDYLVRGYRFGNDPRIQYAATTYTQLGEPRQLGITARYHF